MKKLILILFLTGYLSGCGMEQIDEGSRGVKKIWGKVTESPLSPGFYFYNLFSTSIVDMDVKENKYEGRTDAFTRDTQTVEVNYVLTAYPDPLKIHKIYSQFGIYWNETIINPVVLSSIKDIIGHVNADDLVSKRDYVQSQSLLEIKKSLEKRDVFAIRLDFINLNFHDEYEKAVEAKVVAFQRAQESKNKTVQIMEEAKQKVLQAEADARAMKIKAQALSQNKALVSWEATQRWDGKLPQIILGNQSIPMLDLRNIGEEK